MALAIVSPLVVKLGPLVGDLLLQETKFLNGVSDQVQQLEVELKWMQCFLIDAVARQDETECVRNWVAEIIEASCDVEDIIETYALKVASRRKGGIINTVNRFACILAERIEVHKVRSEITKITTKISNLTRSLQTYGIRSSDGRDTNPLIERQREQRQTFAHVEDTDVVGFEKNIEELVECLVAEEKQHRVVSICGMGGLGKTTLAKKVYHHDKVKRHFDCRAWVYVSQQCHRRQVWEGILVSLLSPSGAERDHISRLKDEEVSEKLYEIQRERKCLVILDDIWKEEAWDLISAAFPSTTDTCSKILVTSRNRGTASYIDPRVFHHELQCLNDEQSWTLLQKKAISWRQDSECKTNMEELGKEMVQCCKGLPLAIIVLGGLLATKQTLEEWNEVHGHVKLNLHKRKDQRFSQVLTLSYDDLPYHLKPCFLYLGHFPEDFEIPTKQLIRMWMAEGFTSSMQVQGIDGRVEKMEDIGEQYLCQLVQRNMVQAGEKGSMSGRMKTCRLHDVMRDLCLSKVKGENFLQCINNWPMGKKEVSVGKVRRFSISFDDNIPIELIPSIFKECPHIRTLLFFGQNSRYINGKLMRSMLKSFKLLRVLNLNNFEAHISKLPENIGSLIHLRFLTLRGVSKEGLPSSLGNLRCLQTLDLVNFRCRQLIIAKVIQKMKQLRHLYLPNYCLLKGKLQLANLSHLQTLVNIPLSVAGLEDLANLTNLTKLTIRLEGTLEKDAKILMPTMEILRSLCVDIVPWTARIDIRPIISSCPHLCKLYVEGMIEKLPEVNQISPNLTKLILRSSSLEEDPLPTLEKLPKLKILHIRHEAFKGENMVCSTRGFPQLQFLHLGGLKELVEWTVEEGAMPSLCRLIIEDCEKLGMIPEGLRFVTTLQELEINFMPKEFTDKIDKGGQDFYKIQHVSSAIISR